MFNKILYYIKWSIILIMIVQVNTKLLTTGSSRIESALDLLMISSLIVFNMFSDGLKKKLVSKNEKN